jgi:hypothetical protein
MNIQRGTKMALEGNPVTRRMKRIYKKVVRRRPGRHDKDGCEEMEDRCNE